MNEFIKTIFNNTVFHTVVAYFSDGTKAEYTINVYNELKKENDVECITDGQTGEVLYNK